LAAKVLIILRTAKGLQGKMKRQFLRLCPFVILQKKFSEKKVKNGKNIHQYNYPIEKQKVKW